LFELAREENAVDQVSRDLDQFERMLGESPDLVRLVRSPIFTADEQSKAIARSSIGPASVGSPETSSDWRPPTAGSSFFPT
jgi:hypothetical protein